MKILKKRLIALISVFSFIMPTSIYAFASDTNTIQPRSATTAYKYWRITSTSRIGSRYVGSESYRTSFDTRNDGAKHTFTHSQSQAGSASIGLSVAYGAVNFSIGYTPGSKLPVSVSTTSGKYKKGTQVNVYTRNREDIFRINQAQYETIHYLNIIDRPTGKTQVGTVYKPAAPSVRFSPESNYKSGSSSSSNTGYSRVLKVTSPLMYGNDVKKVQNRLNQLGYKAGTADGYYGNNTKNAVIRFQKAKGISADGMVGPTTWNKLF